MNLLRFFFLVILQFVFVDSILSAQNSKVKWKKWKEKEFSISYPIEWKVNNDGQYRTALILMSPLESSSDIFQENVNLIIHKVNSMPLEDFMSVTKSQISSGIENGKILSEEYKKTSKEEYVDMYFSGRLENQTLIWYQRNIKKGNLLYSFTFTCAENDFDKYKKTAEQIYTSFKPRK